MKASELMIGDLVKIGQRVVMIDSIIPDSKQVVNGGTFSVVYDDGEYEPIPLTEEMLKKNGFECYQDDKESWSYVLEISSRKAWIEKSCRHGKTYFWISLMARSKDIRYVHEFQHALRLYDMRELADNFKIE